MKYQTLGQGAAEVSVVGLGCMPLTAIYGIPDKSTAIAAVHRSIDLGITHFDTADSYTNGENEELVGAALKAHRKNAFIASKFGQIRRPDGMEINGRPEYVSTACEASLRRLGVDEIDLYYLHRVDPDTPIEETVGAMARLVDQGKVRFLGLSEAGPGTIRRAHATHPITALQTEFSLWTRVAELDLLPLCNELGIAYVAYSPLGRGFLSGAITSKSDLAPDNDSRLNQPRFQNDNLTKNVATLGALEQVAAKNYCSPAQVAIAWVLAQGPHIFPIPGTARPDHVVENCAAVDVRLSSSDFDVLANAFKPEAISGTRYPHAHMSKIGI
jgi:aryl-alcohol dehydrogenase-like predicted oxidoreductase